MPARARSGRDLERFPPRDGQTAVIKSGSELIRAGGFAMTAHHLVEISLFTAMLLFGYYWIAREE